LLAESIDLFLSMLRISFRSLERSVGLGRNLMDNFFDWSVHRFH
jgi:hypothetical protein